MLRSLAPPRPEPRLTLVPSLAPDERADPGVVGRRVAAEVAIVLAGTSAEVMAAAPLTLPLALSVPMARHALSADELVTAMRLLRGAILAVSGLDPATEPAPLVAGDGRRAALILAGYLHDLLFRAAHGTGAAPDALAASAAAHLVGAEPPAALAMADPRLG